LVEDCQVCGAYFGERDRCEKEFGTKGFAYRCRTYGASVWKEVWCRSSDTLAKDKAIETAIELFKDQPDKIRRRLMESKSTLRLDTFVVKSREELQLSNSERRRGLVAKLRFSFEKKNSPRTGYYFFLIYRDQAAAVMGEDDKPDAGELIEKIDVERRDRAYTQIQCRRWFPPGKAGGRCFRVEPSLPVVVVGAFEERPESEGKWVKSSVLYDDPAKLLGVAIDFLHRELK
jgi:hypothetical protein